MRLTCPASAWAAKSSKVKPKIHPRLNPEGCESSGAKPARRPCVFCMMCTSVRVTYVNEPTKCRELLEVPDEHSVRQPRYPALVRDRRFCVPALLPVCPGRTTVHKLCTIMPVLHETEVKAQPALFWYV